MSSPERLVRDGWRSDSLRAGDAVSLVVHPMRDDTNGGQYLSGTGPRGPLSAAQWAVPVSALTPSSTDAISSCPRVELTVVEPSAPSDTRPVRLGEETILVRRAAITTTSDFSEIEVAGVDADTLISIKYHPEVAAKLFDAATDHDGLNLAFVVDDDVCLALGGRGVTE